ncbi:MAG: hypothetical protein AABY22_28365 [Nanoarchaeota archaeon]
MKKLILFLCLLVSHAGPLDSRMVTLPVPQGTYLIESSTNLLTWNKEYTIIVEGEVNVEAIFFVETTKPMAFFRLKAN